MQILVTPGHRTTCSSVSTGANSCKNHTIKTLDLRVEKTTRGAGSSHRLQLHLTKQQIIGTAREQSQPCSEPRDTNQPPHTKQQRYLLTRGGASTWRDGSSHRIRHHPPNLGTRPTHMHVNLGAPMTPTWIITMNTRIAINTICIMLALTFFVLLCRLLELPAATLIVMIGVVVRAPPLGCCLPGFRRFNSNHNPFVANLHHQLSVPFGQIEMLDVIFQSLDVGKPVVALAFFTTIGFLGCSSCLHPGNRGSTAPRVGSREATARLTPIVLTTIDRSSGIFQQFPPNFLVRQIPRHSPSPMPSSTSPTAISIVVTVMAVLTCDPCRAPSDAGIMVSREAPEVRNKR